jgi:hypothetical protein
MITTVKAVVWSFDLNVFYFQKVQKRGWTSSNAMNFKTVLCFMFYHLMTVIKDTDYIGIFIVFVRLVIALLFFVLTTSFGTYLLRDYITYGSHFLHCKSTCTRDVLAVFRLLIRTPVLDLQANPDFHVLTHIFTTMYFIVTCDTSTCRAWQVLHFIQ